MRIGLNCVKISIFSRMLHVLQYTTTLYLFNNSNDPFNYILAITCDTNISYSNVSRNITIYNTNYFLEHQEI